MALESEWAVRPPLLGCELAEFVTPVIERVILFHVHDNFGSIVDVPRGGQIEPLRLDESRARRRIIAVARDGAGARAPPGAPAAGGAPGVAAGAGDAGGAGV